MMYGRLNVKEIENCALLGYYAENSGNFVPDVSGQLIGTFFRGLETLVRNYHYSLRNNPEERILIHFAAEV